MSSSWMTSVAGYGVIVLTVINQVFIEQGIPKDGKGWITLILGIATGVGIALAKDFNKTNSTAAGSPEAHAVGTTPPPTS